KRADINAQDDEGKTALHWAAKQGYEKIVQLLIAEGANIDAQDDEGKTALHWAAKQGYEKIVQLLITVGANVMLKSNDRRRAIHWVDKDEPTGIALLKAELREQCKAFYGVELQEKYLDQIAKKYPYDFKLSKKAVERACFLLFST